MRIYLLSLGAGLLVGIVYSVLNVRSPAPPVVALVGLLGILVGEQLIPFARTLWSKEPAAVSWLYQIKPHMFGHLPTATARTDTPSRTQKLDT
ncbi:XapX domain-containing protein [Rhizobium tibeticum]|uniref:XapX domain-containing protein n=1 Tax=Rhizobium tibeticum TaxID=501024 RepID=UPI002780B3FA|nr:XapX domain-containing protein [Rhizobium tibeticum]MDP9810043.1 XapX domain-containing protein [Rhizobium tibeticum]